MTHDPNGRFLGTQLIGETLSHFADLMKKEIDLATAEISAKMAAKAMAGVWMGVAAFVGLIGLMVLVEAVVFGIASYGIALHWACLIVAVALFVISGGFFLIGRRDAAESMVPSRSVRQLKQDMATAKEQVQ